MKLNFLILALLLLINGCSEKKQSVPFSIKSESHLRELVERAINGDEKINDSLSFLIDPSVPPTGDFNNITTKAFRTLSGEDYYYVLLEHPVPVFNRFAVYDSLLNLYLLNKDLNGFLSVGNLNIDGFEFLLLKESFLSKDVIEINKAQILKIDSSDVYTVFEMYAGIKTPQAEYKQTIEEMNQDRIRTIITGPKKSSVKGDIFIYDPVEQMYLSSNDTFRQMVLEIINNYKKMPELDEITDTVTALRSAGITPPAELLSDSLSKSAAKGFSITLDEGWKEINDLVISDYLHQNMKGTKFINTLLGSEISVLPIPYKDSSEVYVRYPLPQSSEGKYKVRFSQKIETKKDYIQFFEYSCGRNKFLMIFRTPKFSFYENKEAYEAIINSFIMDC